MPVRVPRAENRGGTPGYIDGLARNEIRASLHAARPQGTRAEHPAQLRQPARVLELESQPGLFVCITEGMTREAKVAWMDEHRHAMVAAQSAGHPHMIEVGVGEEHRGEIPRARPEHVQDAYQQRPRAGKTRIDEGKPVVSFEKVAIGVSDPHLKKTRADLDSTLLSISHPVNVRGRRERRKTVAFRVRPAIMSTPRTGTAKLLA